MLSRFTRQYFVLAVRACREIQKYLLSWREAVRKEPRASSRAGDGGWWQTPDTKRGADDLRAPCFGCACGDLASSRGVGREAAEHPLVSPSLPGASVSSAGRGSPGRRAGSAKSLWSVNRMRCALPRLAGTKESPSSTPGVWQSSEKPPASVGCRRIPGTQGVWCPALLPGGLCRWVTRCGG